MTGDMHHFYRKCLRERTPRTRARRARRLTRPGTTQSAVGTGAAPPTRSPPRPPFPFHYPRQQQATTLEITPNGALRPSNSKPPTLPPSARAGGPWRRRNVTVERKRRLYCCGAKLNVVGRGSRRGGQESSMRHHQLRPGGGSPVAHPATDEQRSTDSKSRKL